MNKSVCIPHPQGENAVALLAGCLSWVESDVKTTLFFQRHKFTKAFALESLSSLLTWRLTNLKSQDPAAFPPSPLHILPPPACDILGRPILILRLAKLATLQRDPREHLLCLVEGLRFNLHDINSSSSSSSEGPTHSPVLQYILLVDMEDVSMRNFVRLAPNPHLISEFSPSLI